MTDLLERIGASAPIVQAPMAGVSTPEMAAAVSNAGALGSMGLGAVDAERGRAMILRARAATNRAFNVNLFCHRPAPPDPVREAGWIARLAPAFAAFGAEPPRTLKPVYRSFVEDEAMLAMLLEERPRVVSFHFGLPQPEKIEALRAAGAVLIASATSLAEARAVQAAGLDAVVAQGWEAGGHRGVFDPDAPDEQLGTLALTRLLVVELGLPVIAAGGVMDGAGVAACLALGAVAAQLGTAFVACAESEADDAYRTALMGPASARTVMTRAISGRPARGLPNRFTALGANMRPEEIAGYPMAYDAGKALNAAAKAAGETGYGAQWAGQGAPLARPMPAGELVERLKTELEAARTRISVPPHVGKS